MLTLDDHPLLDAKAFITTFPRPLSEMPSAEATLSYFMPLAEGAPEISPEVKKAVRDLLRHGGFKPAGRSKPASEYLLKARAGGFLSSINLAVDACNAASLKGGLPISVVDMDRATPPFRVGIAEEGASYIFNASGQDINLSGLLCLFDSEGPSANSVKDSQRTKTHEGTRRTLSIIWGTRALPGLAEETFEFYRGLLVAGGASVEVVEV